MANLSRNFTAGRMNKTLDERVVPNGEYIDALNIRMGSTENSEVGVIENAKGNLGLTVLSYDGVNLSDDAKCIGAFEDGAIETIYWLVHDSNYASSPTGKIDLIVSYNTNTLVLTYHVISIREGATSNTTLNFDNQYLVTGIDKREDLLFWTDDLNQPRFINVKRNYADPIAGIDQFTAEQILVIKKPPAAAPIITPTPTSSQDSYLEERFICFAYRYRYEDNEYSATSQWSKPGFLPNAFRYNSSTALNSGMIGSANMALIEYNSGGPLVKSIELLFKEMENPTIRVIEKINKAGQGLADNTVYSFKFQNSQIFTILSNTEILRLYDNVPLLAKSQTMMGNRLMYGNYTEGYDMVDNTNGDVRLEYLVEGISTEVGASDINYSLTSGAYTFGGANTISEAVTYIDFGDADLVAGGLLTVDLRYSFTSYGGAAPFPTDQQVATTISFVYALQKDFANAFLLSQDNDFLEKIGTALPTGNIQTVENACLGTTFTDTFNCSAEQTLEKSIGTLYKYQSGISAAGQPIKILSDSSTPNLIGFQLPVMSYVDDPTFAAINQTVYTYYKIEAADATYAEIGNPSSLHSNRGYEVGMVYMDEFNRASFNLVSPFNAIHFPCANSDLQNRIQVNIPIGQRAPTWATKYKFCIKADADTYEVIYSNFFFRDLLTGDDWFLLEGQNSQKIEIGDELIVKADTTGPLRTCAYTTVLDKTVQAADWLNPAPVDNNGLAIPVPGGVYMKLKANNFSTSNSVGDGLPEVWTRGEIISDTSNYTTGGCAPIYYQIRVDDPLVPGQYIDLPIPAGSKITIKYESFRIGSAGVSKRLYRYEQNFTSSQDYDSFYDWFVGDNIAATLNAPFVQRESGLGQSEPEGTYYSNIASGVTNAPCNLGVGVQFVVEPVNNQMWIVFSGILGYRGKKRRTNNKLDILIQRSNTLVVFETKPIDASPNLWYESTEAYDINTNGEHQGNVQNQNFLSNIPALVLTDFYNCYAFGNGVESYKIQDAILGKKLTLGNRTFITTTTEYKENRRFADITYSGTYNEESNTNKLNEFNLGLLNFKSCEQAFGPINKLVSRQRDILTLQEDRISYVLTDINLLSDAAGGEGVVVSIPKVLGNQIARAEEYGISNNPESFIQWGADKYFTDAKRGSVINLKGQESEQLSVVSMNGMRTWFRDLFNRTFNTQKLGAYDPYMNEYVLSANEVQLPAVVDCAACGVKSSTVVTSITPFLNCYELGDLVGNVTVTYEVLSLTGDFYINAVYNGILNYSGILTTSGILTFNKNVVNEKQMQLAIYASDTVSLNITIGCPEAEEITVILVTVTGDNDAGLLTTNQYRWNDASFVSPLHTESIQFVSSLDVPVVSQYKTITGLQGGGVIPSDFATVTMFNNTFSGDDFQFVIGEDNFRYLRSNTLYENNNTDIKALLAATSIASPIIPPSLGNTFFNAQFNMPLTGDYLYLVWDYRNSTSIDLCYDLSDAFLACCDCVDGPGGAPLTYTIRDCVTGFEYVVLREAYVFILGDVVHYKVGLSGGSGATLCGSIVDLGALSPNASLIDSGTYDCDSDVDCLKCYTYQATTYEPMELGYDYIDCTGTPASGTVGGFGGFMSTFCAKRGSVVISGGITLLEMGPC